MAGNRFIEDINPEAIGRARWETEQTRQDLELMRWVGRFRFVTAEQIASKLGCSVQRANTRVRRLEHLGLLGRGCDHPAQARAIFLTGRGHELLGLPRRRAPRANVQREHEAAIVDLSLGLERHLGSAAIVLTERECRQHDRTATPGTRYSVPLAGHPRGDQRRWPDLVTDTPNGRVAIELELTPKGSARLRSILAAYRASTYTHLVIVARGHALRERISQLAHRTPRTELSDLLEIARCEITVESWTSDVGGANAFALVLAELLAVNP